MIILTSGRSGSQKLMNCLSNRKDIRTFGEIFNLYRQGIDDSLFDFEIPKSKVIDIDIHNRMCAKKYLDLATTKYDVFKILYSHIKGDLYNALDGRDTILLSRRNKFRCLVSVSIAIQTGIWSGNNSIAKSFTMDFNFTRKRIRNMLYEESIHYARYKPTLIYYEDDFEDSYKTVCNKMGIPFESPIISTVPTGIEVEDIVENYEEIKSLDREFYINEKL